MVNPSITAALIAASQQEEIEEKIEGRLKKERAVGPSSAVVMELESKRQALLDVALARGTVKRTSDGRVYLNEQAVADRNEGKGFMALLILLAIVSVFASVAVLSARAG